MQSTRNILLINGNGITTTSCTFFEIISRIYAVTLKKVKEEPSIKGIERINSANMNAIPYENSTKTRN